MLCSLQYKKDGKIGAVTIGGDGIGNKTIMMRIFHRGRKRTQTNKTQDEKKNRGKNLFRERVLFLTHHISISSQGEFLSRQEWRLRETQLLYFRNAPYSFRVSGPAFKGRRTKGRFPRPILPPSGLFPFDQNLMMPPPSTSSSSTLLSTTRKRDHWGRKEAAAAQNKAELNCEFRIFFAHGLDEKGRNTGN